MRKLAWFVIFLLLGLAIFGFACAFSPPLSATAYDVGVNVVGKGIVNGITNLMTGMMAWGSVNLAQASVVFFGTLVGGIIFWTLILRKYIWPRIRPTPTITTSSKPLQGGLIQTGTQAVGPVPAGTVVAEDKKE